MAKAGRALRATGWGMTTSYEQGEGVAPESQHSRVREKVRSVHSEVSHEN